MRIASGGIQHETNTFASTPTTINDFVRDSNCGANLDGGSVIFERFRGTATIHGGYIAGAEAEPFELIPLLCTRAQPAGVVEQRSFNELLNRFLDRMRTIQPVDGVLLDLHGAMVSDQHDDAEGAIIAATRDVVGDEVPVVVTLDLHSNISLRMVQLSNVIIGYDTYPHVDMHERGIEAAHLMARIVRGEVNPVQEYRQLPLITLPPMQCTLREPMQSLIRRVNKLEQQPGILTATVSMGFPFADIPDAGVSILVTSDNDRELAADQANRLAQMLWDLRDDLRPRLTTIQDVIQYVRDHEANGPVLYADGSDNPGGGAPCDGTVALAALIDSGIERAVVGVLFDPETAAQAHAAGIGSSIHVRLGGKTDDRHGDPIEADAYVRALCDGRFVYRGPMMQGIEDHLGPTATLVVGGVEVVVTSVRRQCLDAQILRVADIEPSDRKLIVLKSAVHFRADFGPMASAIFDADTPGIHRPDFDSLDYHNVRRPIYPLDTNTVWQPV